MVRMTGVICSLLAALPALAADPCSDPMCADEGFGASGRVAIDFAYAGADRGNAVVRVPGSDRLYVIGQVETGIAGDADFGVACLLDDGGPCPDFGVQGQVVLAMDFSPAGPGLDAAIAGAVLPWGVDRDWRLVVVGQVEATSTTDTDFGIALLRPDGSLETTASGGKVRVAFDTPGTDFTDLPAAVAVTSDGKILVGGTVDVATGDTDWGFIRLNPNLTIDTDWGTNGRVKLDVAGLAVMHAMLLEPDGQIVAVGSRDFGGDDQMVIARLNEDGTPDAFFGFLGQTVFDWNGPGPADDVAWAVATDPEGRHVIVGESTGPSATCLMAARVLPGGQPDTTFSSASGSATSGDCFSAAVAGGRAVAVREDGRIMIAIETDYWGTHDFALLSREPDDNNWTLYQLAFDLGGSLDDRPRSILIQPDGKIVIAGRVVGPNETLDFGVLRLTSEQIFADGFEAWGSAAEWDSIATAP